VTLTVSLFVCLPVCLFLSVCVSPCVCFPVSVRVTLSVFVSLCVCDSLIVCVSVSLCVSWVFNFHFESAWAKRDKTPFPLLVTKRTKPKSGSMSSASYLVAVNYFTALKSLRKNPAQGMTSLPGMHHGPLLSTSCTWSKKILLSSGQCLTQQDNGLQQLSQKYSFPCAYISSQIANGGQFREFLLQVEHTELKGNLHNLFSDSYFDWDPAEGWCRM